MTKPISLLEILGVPQGIVPAAKNVYNRLITEFEQFPQDTSGLTAVRSLGYVVVSVPAPIGTPSIDIKAVKLILNVSLTSSDKLKIDSFQISNRFTGGQVFRKGKRSKVGPPEVNTSPSSAMLKGIVQVDFNLSVPKPSSGYMVTDLIKDLKAQRLTVISGLAHEIKHIFDQKKQPHGDLKSISQYSGVSTALADEGITSSKTLKKFLYLLYYTSDIEVTVHSTEMAAEMEELGITKSIFHTWLKTTHAYTAYTDAQIYTFDYLYDRLKKTVKIGEDFKNKVAAINPQLRDHPEITLLVQLRRYISQKARFTEYLVQKRTDTDTKEELSISEFDMKRDLPQLKLYYEKLCKKLRKNGNKGLRSLGRLYGLAKDDE